MKSRLTKALRRCALLFCLTAVVYTTSAGWKALYRMKIEEKPHGILSALSNSSHVGFKVSSSKTFASSLSVSPLINNDSDNQQGEKEGILRWGPSDFAVSLFNSTAHASKYRRYEISEDALLSKAFGEAMKPSRIVPYFYRASHQHESEDITITTLMTSNRFAVFAKLVETYQGGYSCCLNAFFRTLTIKCLCLHWSNVRDRSNLSSNPCHRHGRIPCLSPQQPPCSIYLQPLNVHLGRRSPHYRRL